MDTERNGNRVGSTCAADKSADSGGLAAPWLPERVFLVSSAAAGVAAGILLSQGFWWRMIGTALLCYALGSSLGVLIVTTRRQPQVERVGSPPALSPLWPVAVLVLAVLSIAVIRPAAERIDFESKRPQRERAARQALDTVNRQGLWKEGGAEVILSPQDRALSDRGGVVCFDRNEVIFFQSRSPGPLNVPWDPFGIATSRVFDFTDRPNEGQSSLISGVRINGHWWAGWIASGWDPWG